MKSFRCILSAFIVMSSLYAFAQTGKIAGKVIDAKTGETLPGVAVVIEGTSTGAVTDMDGKFQLNNIVPGKYALQFRFISYAPKTIQGVELIAGNVVQVDATLETETTTLKEVIIEASVNRESQNVMLAQQKNLANVSDGISAEIMRKTPDKSTGEALKRVSGTSIQDNKYVIVRGLSDRYNAAMLNGFLLPGTEPDRRSFSFDLFPTAMVDQLTITKTATPDMPAEFAGGVVLVTTKDVPDENFYSFSAGAGYHTLTTSKEYYTYKGGKNDWLGLDDGTRAIPSGFPSTEDFQKLKKTDKVTQSKLFANDWGTEAKSAAPFNKSLQLSMGHRIKIFNNDFGSIFAVTYSDSRKTTESRRRDFNTDTTIIYDYTDMQYKRNVLWGALWNVAYKIGNNNKIKFQNLYNVSAEDQTVRRTGVNIEKEQLVRNAAMQFTSTQLFVSQLSGEHLLPWNNVRLRWGGAYTRTDRNVPNYRKTNYAKNIIPASEEDTLYVANIPASASPDLAGRFYSSLGEYGYNGYADVTIPFVVAGKKQSVKVGTFQNQRFRDFSARVMGMVINDFVKFYMSGGQKLLTLPEDSIFDASHIAVNGFRMDEITNKSDSYEASSRTNSNYLMLDNTLFKKLRLVWGGRMEIYRQQFHGFFTGAGANAPPVNIDTTNIDFLPSVNTIYSLTEKSNIRLSASRTISRPEFRELAPFGFYDFTTSTTVVGNPGLKRALITNIDARYEIYPGSGQLLAATVFYKHFNDPIEQVIASSSSAGSRTITCQNADKAKSYGAEIEFRKNLAFLDKITKCNQFEHIVLFTNAAYIRSEVDLSNVAGATDSLPRPLQGQSPYLLNSGIQYTHPKAGISITFFANRIGRRISEVGTNGYLDIYEAPRTILDFQISKKILKKGEIKLNVSDLLHQDAVFYQDQNFSKRYEPNADTRIMGANAGTSFSLSLSYRF